MRIFSISRLGLLSFFLFAACANQPTAENPKSGEPQQSSATEASPSAHELCRKLQVDIESLGTLSSDSQLNAAIKLTGLIPEVQAIDSETIIADFNRDVAEAWLTYVQPHPSCASTRLKLVRALTKLGVEKTASPESKVQIKKAILQVVTRAHLPFVIESMVNIGSLHEAIEAGVFSVDPVFTKKMASRVKRAKADMAKYSAEFDKVTKGTPLMDPNATDSPDKIKALLRDPKQKKLAEKFKRVVISEIKLATAIRKDTMQFASQLETK